MVSAGRPYILLATMPKSASTFLHRALVELTGFRSVYLASAYRNIEQELYLPSLIDNYDVASVTQQHIRANRINLELLERFKIRPVVLVRDIHDVIVSMRDHFLKERMDNLPGLYVPEAFPELDEQQQLDFVTTFAGPWLISFYASWVIARASTETDILWLHYEHAVNDWPATLRSVVDFYDIECTETNIDRALSEMTQRKKSQLRINKGTPGRGKDILSDEQRQSIVRMSRAYPDIDFSSVGIIRKCP